MAECMRDDSTDCDCDDCRAAEDAFWAEQGDSGGMPPVPANLDEDTDVQVVSEMDRVVEHAYKRERDEARRQLAEVTRDREELRREVAVLQRKLAQQQAEINRMRGARR